MREESADVEQQVFHTPPYSLAITTFAGSDAPPGLAWRIAWKLHDFDRVAAAERRQAQQAAIQFAAQQFPGRAGVIELSLTEPAAEP